MDSLSKHCYDVPKAELQIHIEGTVEPELMFKIAEGNEIKLPYKSVEELKEKYKYNNLQNFLDIYYAGCPALIKKKISKILPLIMSIMLALKDSNILRAFLSHKAIYQEAFLSKLSLLDLRKDWEKYGFNYQLIMWFLRHLSEEDAINTLKKAIPFKHDILAVGLDSSEVGNEPKKFIRVYEIARKEGFKCVAHAGEEGPAQYIAVSIDLLKIKRIDHGVRMEDEQLGKSRQTSNTTYFMSIIQSEVTSLPRFD